MSASRDPSASSDRTAPLPKESRSGFTSASEDEFSVNGDHIVLSTATGASETVREAKISQHEHVKNLFPGVNESEMVTVREMKEPKKVNVKDVFTANHSAGGNQKVDPLNNSSIFEENVNALENLAHEKATDLKLNQDLPGSKETVRVRKDLKPALSDTFPQFKFEPKFAHLTAEKTSNESATRVSKDLTTKDSLGALDENFLQLTAKNTAIEATNNTAENSFKNDVLDSVDKRISSNASGFETLVNSSSESNAKQSFSSLDSKLDSENSRAFESKKVTNVDPFGFLDNSSGKPSGEPNLPNSFDLDSKTNFSGFSPDLNLGIPNGAKSGKDANSGVDSKQDTNSDAIRFTKDTPTKPSVIQTLPNASSDFGFKSKFLGSSANPDKCISSEIISKTDTTSDSLTGFSFGVLPAAAGSFPNFSTSTSSFNTAKLNSVESILSKPNDTFITADTSLETNLKKNEASHPLNVSSGNFQSGTSLISKSKNNDILAQDFSKPSFKHFGNQLNNSSAQSGESLEKNEGKVLKEFESDPLSTVSTQTNFLHEQATPQIERNFVENVNKAPSLMTFKPLEPPSSSLNLISSSLQTDSSFLKGNTASTTEKKDLSTNLKPVKSSTVSPSHVTGGAVQGSIKSLPASGAALQSTRNNLPTNSKPFTAATGLSLSESDSSKAKLNELTKKSSPSSTTLNVKNVPNDSPLRSKNVMDSQKLNSSSFSNASISKQPISQADVSAVLPNHVSSSPSFTNVENPFNKTKENQAIPLGKYIPSDEKIGVPKKVHLSDLQYDKKSNFDEKEEKASSAQEEKKDSVLELPSISNSESGSSLESKEVSPPIQTTPSGSRRISARSPNLNINLNARSPRQRALSTSPKRVNEESLARKSQLILLVLIIIVSGVAVLSRFRDTGASQKVTTEPPKSLSDDSYLYYTDEKHEQDYLVEKVFFQENSKDLPTVFEISEEYLSQSSNEMPSEVPNSVSILEYTEVSNDDSLELQFDEDIDGKSYPKLYLPKVSDEDMPPPARSLYGIISYFVLFLTVFFSSILLLNFCGLSNRAQAAPQPNRNNPLVYNQERYPRY